MKNNFFFSSILTVFLTIPAFGQVSGKAYLSDKVSHEGIKVKFIANSPTAVTDSVQTDSKGFYALPLNGGIYAVSFFKNGYETVYYNQNKLVAVSNTSVLNDVTLQSKDYITVSGDVSGTWQKSKVYQVNGDIKLKEGESLTIEAGTKVLFNGPYKFTINGILTASGVHGDSIYFKANESSQPVLWDGIVFEAGSSAKNIQYWKMEKCLECIDVYTNSFVIKNSCFNNFQSFGIRAGASTNAIIENNTFFDYGRDYIVNQYSSYGIIIKSKSKALCNLLHDFSGTGIVLGDSAEASYNTIYRQQPLGASHYAGIIAEAGSPLITNNFLHENWTSVLVKSLNSPESFNPKILNNTIYGNSNAAIWTEKSHGLIENNLIYNAGRVFYKESSEPYKAENIRYNLFANSQPEFGSSTFLGVIVSNNTNGDPIDSYYNVFANLESDPMPFPPVNSPVKGAGSDKSDIGIKPGGCIQIVNSLSLEMNVNSAIYVYPNPATDNLKVFIGTTSDIKKVDVFSVTGTPAALNVNYDINSGIPVRELKSGMYILYITTGNDLKYAIPFSKQ